MKFSFKIFKRNYKNGFIFSISQVFDFAFARLDIFLLQFLLGSFSVGIYAAGQRVVSVFQLIPSSFHVVELPEFHRVSNDPDKLLSKFIHLRSLLLELSLLVFVPLIINANKIIALLFGNSYSEADSIVVILSFCSILLFVNYPYYMLTEAINKIKMRMYVRIISFCLTCIVVASLIKIIGLTGAAFGLLAGQVLFMILLHILTKEANGGFELILKDFKLILLAIATGYLSYFIGNLFEHVWLIVFTSSLLYLIGFFSIGHFLRYSQTTTLLFTLAKAIISKKNKFFNETKC